MEGVNSENSSRCRDQKRVRWPEAEFQDKYRGSFTERLGSVSVGVFVVLVVVACQELSF